MIHRKRAKKFTASTIKNRKHLNYFCCTLTNTIIINHNFLQAGPMFDPWTNLVFAYSNTNIDRNDTKK